MKKRKIFFGAFLLTAVCVALWVVVFFSEKKSALSDGEKIQVVATFYPVAFLAEEIGRDRVVVKTLVPAGIEPHDFDPPLRDISEIRQARLFLANGAGIDSWAENLRDSLERNGVRVTVLADGEELLDAIEEDGHEGEEVSHQESDPHLWLDPERYMRFGEKVTNALSSIDPEHAMEYRKNYNAFLLRMLPARDGFRLIGQGKCAQDTVIVSHNAFSYPAKRYGFRVLSLAGLSPEAEVSAGEVVDILRIAKEKNIRAVLLESLSNPKAVRVITEETGAIILPFNPIEGLTKEERASGENYFSLQEKNLLSLRKALECE